MVLDALQPVTYLMSGEYELFIDKFLFPLFAQLPHVPPSSSPSSSSRQSVKEEVKRELSPWSSAISPAASGFL